MDSGDNVSMDERIVKTATDGAIEDNDEGLDTQQFLDFEDDEQDDDEFTKQQISSIFQPNRD